MALEDFRLLIDFGFVILIWAVQLVIYPSFGHYTTGRLIRWHKSYTQRVSFIVFPLMVTQLIIVGFQLHNNVDWFTLASVLLVIILWLITFIVFVPLHQSIDKQQPVKDVCTKLVRYNWIRTLLWTTVFLISLIYYFVI